MVIRQKGGKASAKAKAKRDAKSAASDIKKDDDAASAKKDGTLFMRAFSTTPPLEPVRY